MAFMPPILTLFIVATVDARELSGPPMLYRAAQGRGKPLRQPPRLRRGAVKAELSQRQIFSKPTKLHRKEIGRPR